MATKIYEDTVTKELVIIRGTLESRYGAFSDLSRVNDNDTDFSITHSESGRSMLDPVFYGNLHDETGLAYASMGTLKSALDGFFDATV